MNNPNSNGLPDYLEDVTGAINYMDQTIANFSENQNLVIAQKYKMAIDIAEGMNRT